jgi:ABC-type glutathione transport system ATPase component
LPALLEIRDLAVRFPAAGGGRDVLRGLSLEVGRGEIVGLAGESRSGKSVLARAILGLVPPPGRIAAGSIRFDGRELRELPEPGLRRIRGARIGLAWQEPAAALDPCWTIGAHLVETMRAHARTPAAAARARAVELLAALRLERPEACLERFPFELSGGQRLRVVLALALAAGPELLVADEPTSALDATVAVEVLALFAALRRERGLAVLIVSHDLHALAAICDRIAVLDGGRIVEEGPPRELAAAPRHPSTRALFAPPAVA